MRLLAVPCFKFSLFYLLFFAAPMSWGASFTIMNGQTVTTTQTLTVSGETGTIDSGGQLSTSTNAVNLSGIDAKTLTNNGSITSTGAIGVNLAAGNNSVITNTGIISTDSSAAQAILLDAGVSGITFSNSGTISTSNTGGNASVLFRAGSSTFTNSGTISSFGANSNAVEMDTGGNNSLSNTGTITVSGATSIAVNFGTTTNNTLTNNGTISATDSATQAIEGGAGIQTLNLLSDSKVIGSVNLGTGADILNNAGSITTSGASVDAVTINGIGANLVNSGVISASGIGSVAVNINSTGTSFLSNSGTILAASGETAILGGSGAQTLNIESGSQIIGAIDLGAGSDTVNISNVRGISNVLSFTNTENINLGANVVGFVNGNQVITVDSTGFSILGEVLTGVTSQIHHVLAGRQVKKKESEEVSTWVQILGSSRDQDANGGVQAYSHGQTGLIGGYEKRSGKRRLGLSFGFVDSDVDTDANSISLDANTFFAGAYTSFNVHLLDIGLSFLGGYEDYTGNRIVADNLNGYQVAVSEYHNFFFSPSFNLSRSFWLSKEIKLRPFLRGTYSAAFFSDYKEVGTTSANLSVASRAIQTINFKAGAHLNYGMLEIRAGLDSNIYDEEDIEASLGYNNLRFGNTDDDNTWGGFIGFHISKSINKKLNLSLDGELLDANYGSQTLSTYLGLEYSL